MDDCHIKVICSLNVHGKYIFISVLTRAIICVKCEGFFPSAAASLKNFKAKEAISFEPRLPMVSFHKTECPFAGPNPKNVKFHTHSFDK